MEAALEARLRQLLAADDSLGFRTLHAQLKQEPEFAEVSLKKVQTALQQLRATPAAGVREAGPGLSKYPVLELITLSGFSPGSQDENGYTPVMAAASWGHVDLLRILLQRDASAVNVADSDGDTPLHHVAQAIELEADQVRPVLELLLTNGADVSRRNAEGKTCIDACAQGSLVEGDAEEQEPEINLVFLKTMEDLGVQVS
ncbi:Ankyrin repeat-containing protein [Symbiodinium microadriaticum]|uniref:Ankyrin repeat-containing protein n=1 Tax=Symbiodinium microadriaticum TaxID=2951 RepID=A0A1Q9EDQ9_SYMMI|nr:Ankyrin repeat-containing protein [Symbiodinium microadriaticum]